MKHATPKQNPIIFQSFCQQAGLPKPTPEHKFHPKRRWRIDWYFEANGKKLALEVEGGVWSNGRHTRGSGYVGDMEKYNSLAMFGIHLLRVQPKDLLKLETLKMIAVVLAPDS